MNISFYRISGLEVKLRPFGLFNENQHTLSLLCLAWGEMLYDPGMQGLSQALAADLRWMSINQSIRLLLKPTLSILSTQNWQEVCWFLPLLPDVCCHTTFMRRKCFTPHLSLNMSVLPSSFLYITTMLQCVQCLQGLLAQKKPIHLYRCTQAQ